MMLFLVVRYYRICFALFVFFFKQKTAYEMRISDWSSDVCSSDLWTDGEGKPVAGTTIWSIGSAQGDPFAPSTAPFMVNYRVADLHALVKVLREEGCNVLEKIDDSEYGKLDRKSTRLNSSH